MQVDMFVANHRIAGTLVARAQRQVAVRDGRREDVVLHEVALELGCADFRSGLGTVRRERRSTPLRFSTAACDCVVTTMPSAKDKPS